MPLICCAGCGRDVDIKGKRPFVDQFCDRCLLHGRTHIDEQTDRVPDDHWSMVDLEQCDQD